MATAEARAAELSREWSGRVVWRERARNWQPVPLRIIASAIDYADRYQEPVALVWMREDGPWMYTPRRHLDLVLGQGFTFGTWVYPEGWQEHGDGTAG